jgi:two-component system, chemotaxis family, chemotaxis protein CheY
MARILIADNASFMRSCLKYIVENAGHTVVGLAKDGQEAVTMYEDLMPDVLTLDILMGQMDGIAALSKIIQAHPKAKIIMVTAMGQDGVQEEARRLGSSGYIRKPFESKQIVGEISQVIANGSGHP